MVYFMFNISPEGGRMTEKKNGNAHRALTVSEYTQHIHNLYLVLLSNNIS